MSQIQNTMTYIYFTYILTNSREKNLEEFFGCKYFEPICDSQGFCFVIIIKVASVQGCSLEFDLLCCCTATPAEF